jgi:hypothetical protein
MNVQLRRRVRLESLGICDALVPEDVELTDLTVFVPIEGEANPVGRAPGARILSR